MIRSLNADAAQALSLDVQALTGLKERAKTAPQEALGKAAQQFEAMFLNMLMKSMRESLPKDGLFDNEATHTYQGMLDQQWSQVLAKKGVGIAELLTKQLSKQFTAAPANSNTNVKDVEKKTPGVVQSFVDKVKPYAEAASKAMGVPAHYVVAQAGLESGWGKAIPKRNDGSSSHNLFGIKAGKHWRGATVDATTTEYIEGKAVKKVERFRAYASYTDAFQDFARLIRTRYSEALNNNDARAYANSIQRGGYATDPQYAEKLARAIRMTG